MTKTLVLSGYYGFDNAGDEAVLVSILQKLKSENITPIVLSGNPEKTTSLHGVRAIYRYDVKAISEALKQSDGLISGGGSLLQDVTSAKSIFYYLGIMKMAQLHKKPVFCYAQGIGPLTRKWILPITKFVLSKCTYLSVRDEESKQLLEKIGVKKEIDVSIDPVLGLQKQEATLSSPLTHFLKKQPIALSIRPWKNSDMIVQESTKLIEHLVDQNIPVLLLPFHYPQDRDISKEVATHVNDSDLLYVQEHELGVHDLVCVVDSVRLMIGMRLHSLIISASQQTPFIGISYDPKIDAFLSLYNQTSATNAEHFNISHVIEQLEEALDKEERRKEDMKNHFSVMEKRLNLPIEFITTYLKEEQHD